MDYTFDQDTFGETLANSISHGIGTVLSLVGGIILIAWAATYGTSRHLVGVSIFGGSLIILYFASTLYHSLPASRLKYLFQIMDHAAIYLLIAGTYTPFLLVNLRGPWGWSLLSIIWACALVGVLLKIFCMAKFHKSSMALYVLMGWLCVAAGKEFLLHVPPLSLGLLICGGLAYTGGLIFFGWGKLPYHHAVWHLFVLTGSICHYFSVLYTL